MRMRNANLTEARFRDCDFTGADLSYSDLSLAFLPAVYAPNAVLAGVNFTNAVLRGASLNGADLTGADLRGADLRGADLSGANLRGARLEGARFDSARIRDARFKFDTTSRLDVLALLRAHFAERDLDRDVRRAAMRFDAACYGVPRRFDVWSEKGICPYGGEQSTERPITFAERSADWIEGDGERMVDARVVELRDSTPLPGGTPSPLLLLLRLLLAHGCAIEVDGVEATSEDDVPALLVALSPPDTRRFRVELSRTVNVRATRTDSATVYVEAETEDDAREMVEESPEDYVDDWCYGDTEEDGDEDVDEVTIDDVDEA
jgi:hypothetical protein